MEYHRFVYSNRPGKCGKCGHDEGIERHDLNEIPRLPEKGEWVKYRAHKLFKKDVLIGVGIVDFLWRYDGVFIEIDSPVHGRVSMHFDYITNRMAWRPFFGDKLEMIPQPVILSEGVGI